MLYAFLDSPYSLPLIFYFPLFPVITLLRVLNLRLSPPKPTHSTISAIRSLFVLSWLDDLLVAIFTTTLSLYWPVEMNPHH